MHRMYSPRCRESFFPPRHVSRPRHGDRNYLVDQLLLLGHRHGSGTRQQRNVRLRVMKSQVFFKRRGITKSPRLPIFNHQNAPRLLRRLTIILAREVENRPQQVLEEPAKEKSGRPIRDQARTGCGFNLPISRWIVVTQIYLSSFGLARRLPAKPAGGTMISLQSRL